jgi:pimeloyl-ACP methyl ester carboxylesterase
MLTFRARVADYQRRGLVPAELPSPEEDATAMFLALLPVYFVDPRHPGARSLNGATLSAAVWAATDPTLSDYDLRSRLGRVTAPVLSFVSSVPFGVEMGTALAAALPAAMGSRSCRVDGHLPWVESPGPFFAELRRFLGP